MIPDPRNSLTTCRVCRGLVALLLDIGNQPLSNRFLTRPSDKELVYPFQLGQCRQCGLLQLVQPIAAVELKPIKPLRYTEPEAHLDQVVDVLAQLPGIRSDARICGITSKDQSTINRFLGSGFRHAQCLLMKEDLGITDPTAGIETIQQQISDGAIRHRSDQRTYHIVIVRHIFEHVHRMGEFLDQVGALLASDGYLVLEVPDFTNSLLYGDYSTLWEDHVCYFTRTTLCNTLERLGWHVHQAELYPYTPEDSLMVIATRHAAREKHMSSDAPAQIENELTRAQEYASQLPVVRRRWHDLLEAEKRAQSQTALLGVGHLGVMFINVLKLENSLDIVTDDDPEKCGKYLPGSHKLVLEMNALYERPTRLCLLSVSPEGETCVLERHREFLERGGQFRSIFPTSPLACFSRSSVTP